MVFRAIWKYTMITEVTFAFLKAVKENNNLEWMNKNRDLYYLVRDNFWEFCKELIEKTNKLDTSIWALAVKDATFRFNKDIRFTKDKSPYKTNFWVIIRKEGKHGNSAGYYVDIWPGQSFIWWGLYLPPRAIAERIRMYIAKNYTQFQKIISAPVFKKTFGVVLWEQYKRVPKWFDPNHKAGEFLKMKSRYIGHDISDKTVLQKDFIDYCLSVFKVLKPLNDFLNKWVFYTEPFQKS